MKRITWLVMIGALLLAAATRVAQATDAYGMFPTMINYQGVLTDRSGTTLNGAYHMHFRLWNQETGGTMFWEEDQTGIVVANGIFNVKLGAITPFDVGKDFRYMRWLEIQVEDDPPMSPRRQLLTSPYAFKAGFTGVLYNIPVGGHTTVDIPIPCYSSFQVNASELAGTSDQTAWMAGGANDDQLSYVGINGDGTVVHGTCPLYTPCTILTIKPGLVLRSKGDGSYTLVLDSTGCGGESRAIFLGNHTVPQGGPY